MRNLITLTLVAAFLLFSCGGSPSPESEENLDTTLVESVELEGTEFQTAEEIVEVDQEIETDEQEEQGEQEEEKEEPEWVAQYPAAAEALRSLVDDLGEWQCEAKNEGFIVLTTKMYGCHGDFIVFNRATGKATIYSDDNMLEGTFYYLIGDKLVFGHEIDWMSGFTVYNAATGRELKEVAACSIRRKGDRLLYYTRENIYDQAPAGKECFTFDYETGEEYADNLAEDPLDEESERYYEEFELNLETFESSTTGRCLRENIIPS